MDLKDVGLEKESSFGETRKIIPVVRGGVS